LLPLLGYSPQKTIDPDEAVALGCAVHVGVLDGKEGMQGVESNASGHSTRCSGKQRGEGKFDEFFDDGEAFGDVETFKD
jgi:hypothetical protein